MASFTSPIRALLFVLGIFALALPSAADRILETNSLNSCQANSGFTASLFNLRYTPSKNSIDVNISAVSTIEARVKFDVAISAYGYEFYSLIIDPCELDLAGFCPMVSGNLDDPFSMNVDPGTANLVPGIAYSFPDIDAKVRIYINATSGPMEGQSVACLEAHVSNGKTVDLIGVKWASAIVAGLALVSSAFLSGLGHSNAASHVAAIALALTSYFQAQAIIGLVGIPLPPVVQSWTQDFQWSLGIVNVDFLQRIFTWYQRSTGGTAARIIDTLATVSVQVQKRSEPLVSPGMGLFKRAEAIMPRSLPSHALDFVKRGNVKTEYGTYIVYGIQRVAFRAGIETTNIFLTGIVSFYVVMVFAAILVALFKGACELAAKARWINRDTFLDFRNGWLTVLKGILFRITLLGYAPVTILSLWEFTQRDSAAEVLLAVFFLLYVNIGLFWASYKLIRIAHRSVSLHRNPAYILFSDPLTLNKWGFLYIQFRASAYYFIVPVLAYTVVKAFFIAFAQNAGTVQAIGLLIIEAAALIAASVLRPWMDKKINSFNIAICAVNFINAIFLLIFTKIFDQPDIVTGVVGVVLWILNAATTLILLLMLIISTAIVFFTDNPDGRYKFMGDDRTSFMKSQSQLAATGELDALAMTARGEKPGYGSGLDDNDSLQPPSFQQAPRSRPQSINNRAVRSSLATVSTTSTMRNDRARHSADQRSSISPNEGEISRTASPSVHTISRAQNASPWQRGAGYDH
ncbi:putative calcium-related spray protein [Rosellinia necatrix]|uniref:Putative calcium-related spray protein n=1 Tax=Rosellinia necatrix TaxID=77044 RepID=A0A1W2TFP2_ROSNE|nr:putative calcium-related spray protein [Rosellinia necatrix]